MDTFHADRLTGVGGSDAAALLGLSPWRTPLQLYLEKVGEGPAPEPPTDAQRWGTMLEALVRQEYCNVTGDTVTVPATMLRHPRYPWMIGHLDGITGSGKVYEGKTARFATGWGEPGTDEIPDYYLAQVQHYLMLTGADAADVAVLIHGSDFRIYTVPADPELQALLVEEEGAFWQRVVNRQPPDPVTVEDAARRWRRSRPQGVQASEEVLALVQQLRDTREALTRYEVVQEAVQLQLLQAMGEADTLLHGQEVLATWKSTKDGEKLDAKLVQAKFPEAYAACVKPVPGSRRFLLKKQKGEANGD